MEKLHKLLSYLPIFIVTNWVICFVFLRNTYFYKENYYKFDFIDTVLTAICLMHFFFYHNYYSIKNKENIICILAIIFLTLLYPLLNENIYYVLYISIISITVLRTIY